MKGGPQGFAKYYIDDMLIAQCGPKNMMLDANDDVYFDFALRLCVGA
jgi:hypothetical protein